MILIYFILFLFIYFQIRPTQSLYFNIFGNSEGQMTYLQTSESESPGLLAEPTLRLIKGFSFPYGISVAYLLP